MLQLLHELPDQIDPLGNLSTVARARALSLGMQPAIATQIARHFESDPDAIGELARMVRAVQPSAIPTLCEMLGSFESATARRRLIDLLVEIGPVTSALLQPFSKTSWYLVRNVALILGEIGDEAARRVVACRHHPSGSPRPQGSREGGGTVHRGRRPGPSGPRAA
ncbi:MAG: hypothetical protein R3E12_05470 [Candidatus Eisenbacteria bacterium]